MTDIEKIRAEIQRRYEHHLGCMQGSRDDTYPEISRAHHRVIKDELFEILCFLDILKEEPVSEDLEEFARANANKEYPPEHEMADDNWKQRAGFVKGFKAGAKWEKEKIISKICDWLLTHSMDYLEFGEAGFGATINEKKMIEDITKEIQK